MRNLRLPLLPILIRPIRRRTRRTIELAAKLRHALRLAHFHGGPPRPLDPVLVVAAVSVGAVVRVVAATRIGFHYSSLVPLLASEEEEACAQTGDQGDGDADADADFGACAHAAGGCGFGGLRGVAGVRCG